jgi:heme-degrading monooxygenase HmoA
MVLEHAVISVRPGTSESFEAALREARAVIAGAQGFRSFEAHRGVESPDQYLLLIGWETLKDHMAGFRESEDFARWRALIGPYFASPPVVVHFAPLGHSA